MLNQVQYHQAFVEGKDSDNDDDDDDDDDDEGKTKKKSKKVGFQGEAIL